MTQSYKRQKQARIRNTTFKENLNIPFYRKHNIDGSGPIVWVWGLIITKSGFSDYLDRKRGRTGKRHLSVEVKSSFNSTRFKNHKIM